ncbi:hypothetical protein CK203_062510 [Vitis vinifera]|uniref:Uncharacterized protein n=1 Tax=Vitis vinifera TaxID=29760 RepID=A0A438G4R2_VITVI|nr:hypothetical protein CK203_062510 [Vitis vinifera]
MEAALSCYFTLHFRSSSIACNSPFPKTPFFIRVAPIAALRLAMVPGGEAAAARSPRF